MHTLLKLSLALLLSFLGCTSVAAAALESCPDSIAPPPAPDTIAAAPDSVAAAPDTTKKFWVRQLIDNGFHINAPGINYPRFPRFCLKVYNWGNRVFNTYDSTYVKPTGKNWKLLAKSYNWGESYVIAFPERMRVLMMSDVNADVGGYICFMAVSVGYMFNANHIFAHQSNPRHNFNFNFTCALFSADLYYTKTNGGVKIKRFGDYQDGHHISVPFDAISNTTLNTRLTYFFNHRRYSHAAAYCFSKYHLKSAGTWIIGAATSRQEINMDFASLPSDMLAYLPVKQFYYNFKYRDYNITGGYAHNWVLYPRRWLINLTALPAIGYKHTNRNSSVGSQDMFSTNITILSSAVYNHRDLFCAAQVRFDGYVYFGRPFTFLNSQESLLVTVGVRF